jgi:hypothetical protein
MKTLIQPAALLLACVTAYGQSIVADSYSANSGATRGFLLGEGVNFSINPPATRLTGSAAAGLRYIATETSKAATSYRITGGKVSVAAAANSGRFTLSDGTTPFDFGPALNIGMATAANPVVYDVTISMANSSASNQRFSFALGTAENNANFWDFGLQLYRATTTADYYAIGKRIDQVSYTTATDSTGTTGDINAGITTTAAGTFGSELGFLMRVTDAGAETSTFNSRVRLSLDGGSSWFYDTQSDSLLTSGFRFDTTSRYFIWDLAAQAAATYDNFSVTIITPAVPEPSVVAVGLLAGVVGLIRRRR